MWRAEILYVDVNMEVTTLSLKGHSAETSDGGAKMGT